MGCASLIGGCHLFGAWVGLVAQIARYCDTIAAIPISRDTFSGRLALPQNGAIPPLGTEFHTGTSVRYPILQHIARKLCDTPLKQAQNSFVILSLQASRYQSIATGPLSWSTISGVMNQHHVHASVLVVMRASPPGAVLKTDNAKAAQPITLISSCQGKETDACRENFVRGLGKGLAGGGWRLTGPKMQQNCSQHCVLLLLRGA